MTEFNEMQSLKRRFFAMRNGALAEQMRRQGAPYEIIFGLNIPQLVEIAATIEQSREFAERLWANTTTRESLLLAPMIYPEGEMTEEKALEWAKSCRTAEVSDVLCHRLLRKLPFAPEIVEALADSDVDMERYLSLRLLLNLIQRGQVADTRAGIAAAEAELARDCQLTRGVARQVLSEISDGLDESD